MLAGVDPSATPIGDWADATWAEYVGFVLDASAAGGQPVTEKIDETWTAMTVPADEAPAAPTTPTAPTAGGDLPRSASTPTPGRTIRNVAVDPETGLPRRPSAEERATWAAASAQHSDLVGLMGDTSGQFGTADRLGG